MSDLRWEDPPPTRQRGRAVMNYRTLTGALKERPGEWAVLSEDADRQAVTNLKQRYPDFEFTSRALDGERRRCVVYGRFVGAS